MACSKSSTTARSRIWNTITGECLLFNGLNSSASFAFFLKSNAEKKLPYTTSIIFLPLFPTPCIQVRATRRSSHSQQRLIRMKCFSGSHDELADPTDVAALIAQMPQNVTYHRELYKYAHLDYGMCYRCIRVLFCNTLHSYSHS